MSKIDVHMSICEDLNALYARKNADYGDSFGKSFEEYGLTMACMRLEDKLNRLKALRNKDAQVADESIADTLMDLANYAIMTLMELSPVKPVVTCAKNNHDPDCMINDRSCLCNTCANDCPECCYGVDHYQIKCPIGSCPDYVKED